MTTPAGLGVGTGGAASAGGALAGFEALLVALFGQPEAAVAPQAPAATSAATAPAEGMVAADEPGEIAGDAAVEADPPADLLLALATPAPVQTVHTVPTAARATDEAAPNAWGRDKAKGAPAAPAVAHGNPHARVAEKAAVDAEAEVEAAPRSPAAPVQTAKIEAPLSPSPARPGAAPTVPATPSAPAAQVAPAPVGQAAAPVDAPVAAAVVEGEAPPAPQPTAAAASAPATAPPPAATPVAATPVPAAAPRPAAKAERTKASDEPSPTAPAKAATANAAPAARANGQPKTEALVAVAEPATRPAESEARAPEAREHADGAPAAETRSASGASYAQAAPSLPVRGSPETVANLAAQIVKKLEGRSTRFDVELDPLGLGKVDVRVEIGAHGRVTAAMTFETPQAAAELKARAGELHRALEQAGFELSGGLSFDVAGDRGQARQDWREAGEGFRGRAFQQALETAGEADVAATGALRLRQGVTGGVDVRI